MIKIKEIISLLGEDIVNIYGYQDNILIKYLKASEDVDTLTLDWVNPGKKNQQQIAENSVARVIVVDESVAYSRLLEQQKKVIIQVENPKLVIARIGAEFFVEKNKPGIDKSAVINPKAKIGQNIFIGANVSIGNCEIGNRVTIYPNVVIFDGVKIGNDVTIKSGAILGSEGFGFERDADGNLIKFPQLGKLVIHDKVEVGSNTCIDKGALSDTIIGEGTKINNLCHIAHNVITGKNVVITAHVNISGSSIIEDNVWIAPNASLRGHQTIGKVAVIGMGAVVTKNVPAGETWVGNPARKLEK